MLVAATRFGSRRIRRLRAHARGMLHVLPVVPSRFLRGTCGPPVRRIRAAQAVQCLQARVNVAWIWHGPEYLRGAPISPPR